MCSTGACVEVAVTADAVLVRDSNKVESPVLNFSSAAWRNLLVDIRAGTYDR